LPSPHCSAQHPKISFGIEQDALPYILGGYFVSGWVGREKTRLRFAYANTQVPALARPSGIASDQIRAFGMAYEFFFCDDYSGLWFGPGIGFWTNDATTDRGFPIQNESMVFTFGGGYNWFLNSWFYISPWVATHFRVSGTDPQIIDRTEYRPTVFTPEISLKLGVHFPLKGNRD